MTGRAQELVEKQMSWLVQMFSMKMTHPWWGRKCLSSYQKAMNRAWIPRWGSILEVGFREDDLTASWARPVARNVSGIDDSSVVIGLALEVTPQLHFEVQSRLSFEQVNILQHQKNGLD